MAQGIRVKVHDRALVGALRRARNRCINMQEVWEDIGAEVRDSIHENFDAGGRPKPWVDWSTSYAKWRNQNKPGDILKLDGRLMNSITYEAESDRVRVGTNVEYAATHNFGDKKRGIPQREFLVIQDSDWPKLTAIVEEHIIEGFNNG